MLKDRVVVAALVGWLFAGALAAAPQGSCLSSLATYGAPIGYYVEFGDFNGDGLDDMVVGESWGSRIHVRLRQADGSFGQAALYPSCSQAGPSCVTDLDGDGDLDVVVQQMHSGGTLFGFHYGDGQGGFGPFISIEAGAYVQGVIALDINGDGLDDLVRTGSDARVWRRQGAAYVADVSGVWGLISGPVIGVQDMNGDGSRDVIEASGSGVGTTVHYCDTQFQVIASEQLAAFDIVYNSADFADYDKDGFLDVASTIGGTNSAASGSVVLITGGPGNYHTAALPCVATAVNLAFVDLHADGYEDLALINGTSSSATGLQVLDNPCGSFVTCVSWPTQVSWIQSVATLDYDLNGSVDLMCYGHTSGLEVFGNCTVGPACASSAAVNYGFGCGSPTLTMSPGANPLIGAIASATISNAPLPFGGVTLGFSNTALGGLPILPFSLTGLGMPGCFLWHSNEISGLPIVPVSPGVLSFSAAIPGDANLLGTHVYLQAYCVDLNASPRKLITSNGVDWTIGNQ